MMVFNKNNTSRGGISGLRSWMLIGDSNAAVRNISLQYSEVDINGEQPQHEHNPEQCYFIIEGAGLMTVGGETRQVSKGDAVHIPANVTHGIKNTGDSVLIYLTSNTPAFSRDYESTLWNIKPE